MKISLEQHLRDYAASFYNGQPENDRNIRLKIDHTFRVRDEARRIAAAELPDPAERSLAERAALLHDLSRFEQFARFGTFKDAASFDHGDRSAELAAEQHLLDDLDEAAQADVLDAIRSHNKLAIPGTLSERGTVLAQVVRDADKIDILRVNVETPMEEIYNVSTAALRRSPVTPAVLDAFKDTVEGYKLQSMGVILSYICPLMYMNNPLCKKKAVITNSNKLRTYTSARYYTDAEILDILSGKEGR